MDNSDYIVKPLATALVAYAIDQFVLKETNQNKSMSIAASAGIGATTGMIVGSIIPTIDLGTYFGNGVVLSKDESHLLMTETEREMNVDNSSHKSFLYNNTKKSV